MAMSPALKAYVAQHKAAQKKAAPKVGTPVDADHAMEASEPVVAQLPPQMVHAIKSSRKGQIPPGLAKYMASKKK